MVIILKTIATLLVFIAVLLVGFATLYTRAPGACEKPISYSVGSFDRRFDISMEEFLDAVSKAESIWEEPLGRELFIYSPEESILAINLTYDYRQETTEALSSIEDSVEHNQSLYNLLKERLATAKAEYEAMEGVFEEEVEAFNARNAEHQSQVEKWNAGSRTSKKDFQKLNQEGNLLQAEADRLGQAENLLNKKAQEANSLVVELNHLAGVLNLRVEEYNTIGATRGETFTGGIYYSTRDEQSIDIYEFSDKQKLVKVLAHELGHALGLDHVNASGSVMYYINEGELGALSVADLVALRSLCGEE